MPRPSQSIVWTTPGLKLLVAALLWAGCKAPGPPSHGARQIYPAKEVTRTDTAAHLVEITSLAVDSAGAIYIGDFYTGRITIFRPDGRLHRTVGRRGSGPGEYRQIRTLAIGPGDSLEVYDAGLARLSVYAPSAEQPSYSMDVRERLGAVPKQLWRMEGGSLWLALFEERSDGREYRGELVERWTIYRSTGEAIADSVAIASRRPMLRVEVSGTRFLTPDPFRVGGLVAVGPKRSIARTAANTDTVYLIRQENGATSRQFLITHSPPTITEADREEFITSIGVDWVEPAIRRLLDREAPAHWPLITNLTIDSAGRLWIQPGTRPSERTSWWVLDAAGEHLFSVSLPADAVVKAVLGSRVYASRTSMIGEAYVSVFQIFEGERGGAS